MNTLLAKHREAIKSANGWIKLLKDQAQVSHSTEMASSSILSLADTLKGLLDAHGELFDKCGSVQKELDELKRKIAEKKPSVVKKEENHNAA